VRRSDFRAHRRRGDETHEEAAMSYDPDRLRQLGKRHQRLRADLDALRPDLADEIRAAAKAGVPQVEIVKATGYTRDRIYHICID
jgi:hypothetical protein